MPLGNGREGTSSRANASSWLCTGFGEALGSRAPPGKGQCLPLPVACLLLACKLGLCSQGSLDSKKGSKAH